MTRILQLGSFTELLWLKDGGDSNLVVFWIVHNQPIGVKQIWSSMLPRFHFAKWHNSGWGESSFIVHVIIARYPRNPFSRGRLGTRHWGDNFPQAQDFSRKGQAAKWCSCFVWLLREKKPLIHVQSEVKSTPSLVVLFYATAAVYFKATLLQVWLDSTNKQCCAILSKGYRKYGFECIVFCRRQIQFDHKKFTGEDLTLYFELKYKYFWSLKLILPLSCETFVLYFRCNWHGGWNLNFYLLISLNGSVKLCALFAGRPFQCTKVLRHLTDLLLTKLFRLSVIFPHLSSRHHTITGWVTLFWCRPHCFCCVYQIVLILTRCIYIAQWVRSVSKQGHLQPRCHSEARSPSRQL